MVRSNREKRHDVAFRPDETDINVESESLFDILFNTLSLLMLELLKKNRDCIDDCMGKSDALERSIPESSDASIPRFDISLA